MNEVTIKKGNLNLNY